MRFQKIQLFTAVDGLTVKPLKLTLIHLAAQLGCQNIQRPKACIVAGLLIFLTGISQADDQPAFGTVTGHGSKQIGDGSAAVNVGNGPGKDRSHVQKFQLVAFGVAARVSKNAIDAAREKGIKVGMIRPITLWPFPKEALLKAADKVDKFISVELNMGQMKDDVELAIRCKKEVLLCNRTGGMIPTVENVLDKIEEAIGGTK